MGLAVKQVHGLSMVPLLQPNQKVLIRLTPTRSELQQGSILALQSNDGELVLHRLIDFTPEGHLITQGDNSREPDIPWHIHQVFGMLVGVSGPRGIWRAPRRGISLAVLWLNRMRNKSMIHDRLIRLIRQIINPFAWRQMDEPVHLKEDLFIGNSTTANVICSDDHRWVIQQLDDECAVFDEEKGDIYVLNRMAEHIWREAKEGKEIDQIVQQLTLQYPKVGLKSLISDVGKTLNELQTIGLLSIPNINGEEST